MRPLWVLSSRTLETALESKIRDPYRLDLGREFMSRTLVSFILCILVYSVPDSTLIVK
ncbi:hypothetical protein SBA5_10015 [Candidatus Sulfotelmatomonas gaucii]|uniref:Uncharacterized protein n=1 Tax=Candidatus Sulfuritelmatomonas gaucii TaxID=2043161 RepID=A0A2N9L279_9BACT|nr:hypothetical protein SBA5_10015 [Candidatus Sulfotelmatomonas gaucii]